MKNSHDYTEYRHLDAQKHAVKACVRHAVENTQEGRISSVERLTKEINNWWHQHGRHQFEVEIGENPVTEGHLRRLRQEGKGFCNHQPMQVIHLFFMHTPNERLRLLDAGGTVANQNSPESGFTRAMRERFRQSTSKPYGILKGMVGIYQGYRPNWTKGAHDEVILSKVEVYEGHGGFWLKETQNFHATHENKPIDEVDHGPLIPISDAITCLSKSTDNSCLKLYSFHDRDADLTNVNDQGLAWTSGHVMAVSNRGPHWSSPIYLVNARENPPILRSIHTDEAKELNLPGAVNAINYLRCEQTPRNLLPPEPKN